MKRKNILNIVLVVIMLLTACSKDEIDVWSDKGFAWFTNQNNDFTFASHPEIAENGTYLVPIPIRVASVVSDRDRVIDVNITRMPSDNRTTFELQKPVLFRANHIIDTMFVKVTNSAHLAAVHDTISFTITESEDFAPGLIDNVSTNLCLFNGFAKPSWWNANCNYYMGYFTQLKMSVYYAVTGGAESPIDDDGWQGNKFRFLIYMLREYVTKNDVRYPDDDENAPGQLVTFSNRAY
jgi:hypothetical protein